MGQNSGHGGPRYAAVGVASTRVGVELPSDGSSMSGLLESIQGTFSFRPAKFQPLLPLGYFANVIDLGGGAGLAISTDGVGTKILIAQMMDKYDTVGIDCVAMNVNDVICVGAEPIAMTDYIAVQVADDRLLTELGKGLLRGARQATISIPGGEIAQVAEMMHGVREGRAFDLVGTCVGTVATDRILVGHNVRDGDIIVGLASSGVHSNGLTLARQVFFDGAKMRVGNYVPDFGRTVGEELLEPTAIYVSFAMSCLRKGLPIKAFAHITSDGFFNLARVRADVGFVIEHLFDIPPVFRLIQELGGISDAEMFQVYNMGVGFCAITAPESVDDVLAVARLDGHRALVLGQVVADRERHVHIPAKRLRGKDGSFRRY